MRIEGYVAAVFRGHFEEVHFVETLLRELPFTRVKTEQGADGMFSTRATITIAQYEAIRQKLDKWK